MGLSLEQCQAFLVLFFLNGILLSVLTFLAELYIAFKRKYKPQSKLWRQLEIFFDGKRHYLKDLAKWLKLNCIDVNSSNQLYRTYEWVAFDFVALKKVDTIRNLSEIN